MTITEMQPADIPAVVALLAESYACLGERERLSPEQVDYLVTRRGSAACVERESKTERYLIARGGSRTRDGNASREDGVTRNCGIAGDDRPAPDRGAGRDTPVARGFEPVLGVVSIREDTITKLYVHPARQGQGIGRRLFEAAEQIIRSSGHDRIRLGAFPTAVPFYERMGMEITGRKAAKGALAERTVLLMGKSLREAGEV